MFLFYLTGKSRSRDGGHVLGSTCWGEWGVINGLFPLGSRDEGSFITVKLDPHLLLGGVPLTRHPDVSRDRIYELKTQTWLDCDNWTHKFLTIHWTLSSWSCGDRQNIITENNLADLVSSSKSRDPRSSWKRSESREQQVR